jgi:hypothetical protein
MYALARDLGTSRLGAAVTALAFAFSGYMVARGSFLTEIAALAWLPLLWLCGERLMTRHRLRDGVCLSVVIALQFLAGHAQTWFYSLVSLVLFLLWKVVRSPRGTRKKALQVAGLAALALVWGVALAGVQFLPTLELSRLSGRTDRQGWETFALQYSLWPWRLLTLLLPDFFGSPAQGDYWGYATYWEDAGYIGVLPFLLALFAIAAWLRWRRRLPSPLLAHVPFLASLAGFSLLMALGKNTPFYLFFFRYVPLFDSFQAPARWLCIYTPAVALLSGVGTDLLRPARKVVYVCRLGIAGGLGIALTAVVAKRLLDVKVTFFDPLIRFAFLFVAALLLLLWGLRVWGGKTLRLGRIGLPPIAWQIAVFVLVALDLILAGWHLNPSMDASLYAPQTQIGAFMTDDGPQGRTFAFAAGREEVMFGRYLDFGDYGPNDVAYWWGMREALLPDLGMIERLPSANTFEPLVEGRYHTLLETVDDLPRETALRLLGMMNVAYVLEPASDTRAPGPQAPVAYRSPSVDVYRNPDRLPRSYVVCQARVVSGPQEALAALLSAGFDPSQEVVLELSEDSFTPDSSLPACTMQPATFLPSSPDQVTIRAVLTDPGYLVLADTFYPGWQVFVDGEESVLLRANYAFRAVALEDGDHEVRFRYRPRSFVVGLVCSMIALFGAVMTWFRKQRPEQG